MAVSKRTRYEVMKRDNFTCRYCRSTEEKLTVDHVIPVALGGTDDPGNLVAACADCNAGKGSTSPTDATIEGVKNSDAKWAEAIKRAAEVQAAANGVFSKYMCEFAEAWPQYRDKNLPRDFESSIRSIYEAGLPVEQMRHAVDVAMSAPNVVDRFRYFCGVCWRQVRELQEIAKSLLETDLEVSDGTN